MTGTERYKEILNIFEESDTDMDEYSSSEDEIFPELPAPVSYESERMFLISRINYLMNKVKSMSKDIDELLDR